MKGFTTEPESTAWVHMAQFFKSSFSLACVRVEALIGSCVLPLSAMQGSGAHCWCHHSTKTLFQYRDIDLARNAQSCCFVVFGHIVMSSRFQDSRVLSSAFCVADDSCHDFRF